MGLSTTGTEFNLYDNTTGAYLEGGQAVTNTIAGWLALFPSLDDESLQEIRLAIGLASGGTGTGESATREFLRCDRALGRSGADLTRAVIHPSGRHGLERSPQTHPEPPRLSKDTLAIVGLAAKRKQWRVTTS